ncbi:MAG: DUF4129 domain-containing protein [Bacteroidota bacterium]
MDSEISEAKFDEAAWKNTISEIDYSNQVEVEKKESDFDEDEGVGHGRAYESDEFAPPADVGDFWRGFFKFFLIALAVIILAFIIANMVGAEGWSLAPSNKRVQPAKNAIPITLENIEDNIYESDLDRFIREALEKGNHAQAVRLYYLAIIKELSLKKWIRWKKDKTNRDYIRELTNTNFQSGFKNVTRMFERVWYGKQKLSDTAFKTTVQPELKDMLTDSQKASKKI